MWSDGRIVSKRVPTAGDLCRKHGVVMLPLFEVADIDQARAALTGGGAELLGAVESDAAWRWFLARRPGGNLYSFGARRR
jgi:hypothetical protein